MAERAPRDPARAMLFEQSTTTTVSVMYFSYVCWQCCLAPAHSRVAALPPPPMPIQTPRPQPAPEPRSTTASLKPVEPSKTSDAEWQDLAGVKAKAARYDIWRALDRTQPQGVEVSLKDSPAKTVTPRSIAPDSLSFAAANADGTEEAIPFADVSRLRVLSA